MDGIASFEEESDAKKEEDEMTNCANYAEADCGAAEFYTDVHGENDAEVDDGEGDTREVWFAGLGERDSESGMEFDRGEEGFKVILRRIIEPFDCGVVEVGSLATGGEIFVGVKDFEVDFELAVLVGDGDSFGHPICGGVGAIFFVPEGKGGNIVALNAECGLPTFVKKCSFVDPDIAFVDTSDGSLLRNDESNWYGGFVWEFVFEGFETRPKVEVVEFSVVDIEEGYVHDCRNEIAFYMDDPDDVIREIGSSEESEDVGSGNC